MGAKRLGASVAKSWVVRAEERPVGGAIKKLFVGAVKIKAMSRLLKTNDVAIRKNKKQSCKVDFSLPNKNLKHAAFTLAEILLVIGIIGIVAMLTIPQLIQNTNEKQLVSAFLKTHSVLSNAIKEAEVTEEIKLNKIANKEFNVRDNYPDIFNSSLAYFASDVFPNTAYDNIQISCGTGDSLANRASYRVSLKNGEPYVFVGHKQNFAKDVECLCVVK